MRIKPAVLQTDIALYHLLNRQVGARAIYLLMRVVTQLGETYAGVLAGVLAILIGSVNGHALGIHAPMVIGLSQLVVQILKRVVNRPRPYLAHEKSLAMNPPSCRYSFPSGHTACAFAWCLVFASFFPTLRLLLYTLATLVGLSRIVLGFHYPTDVVMGAGISYAAYVVVVSVM